MADFATGQDLITYYDARVIGDLLSDAGVRVSEAQIPSNPKVLAMLARATGEIKAALTANRRYTEDELEDLAAANDEFLKGLCVELAYGYLIQRRGTDDEIPPQVNQAKLTILGIRQGEIVLDSDEHREAGLTQSSYLTLSKRSEVNMVADRRRFFPARDRYG